MLCVFLFIHTFHEISTSTIATIEQSVFDVNETLSAEVTGIAALLVDFQVRLCCALNSTFITHAYKMTKYGQSFISKQLAFDTSGRQMERISNEIEIMEANSTNYFDYFSTALDYLRKL